ncbi:MAG: hypothetical protein CMM58_13265 [Rhodospirillaceae bacterium]|nr:hypothetical protein [Rhodospirillaceae bacterium]|tara:strand:- start:221 stop:748 length:528 start_codon:yes stop_codon:yes gene_type:complete
MIEKKILIVVMIGFFSLAGYGCANKPMQAEFCPKVGFVNGIDRVTVFDESKSEDNPVILFSAQMRRLETSCKFDDNGVTVSAEFSLHSSLAKEQGATVVEALYLVAALHPDGRILAKETFDLNIRFPAGETRLSQDEAIALFIPSSGGRDFRGYRILLGFQLSKSQIDYNRRLLD